MKTFLSILRGINVSGQKKILMADLKNLYEELNFKDTSTYIQSGNVIFNNKSEKGLSKKIEQKIFEKYYFNVPVIIRTSEEMSDIIEKNPFLNKKDIDASKLYVIYLSEEPLIEHVDKIQKYNFNPDAFYISGRQVYLNCADGYGKTKFTNNFFESKLNVIATTRNWKTTIELSKMMKSN